MYISLWENYRGHPDNVSFMQFSTKIDGFEQKDSQGFENSWNSYEQYPLENFLLFTIYQNYTLALKLSPKSHARKFSRNGVGLGYLMVVTGFAWQLQGLRGYYGVYTAHTGQEGCHAQTPRTSQVSPNSQFMVTICPCADKGHSDQDCEIAIELKYWMRRHASCVMHIHVCISCI